MFYSYLNPVELYKSMDAKTKAYCQNAIQPLHHNYLLIGQSRSIGTR